ncbi:MAG: secretin N-terminal domain-containing protein [Arenicellales bacterium]
MKQFCLVLLFYAATFSVVQAQKMVTEVVPLGYRSVNEIVPIIRPLVSPGGSVSGLQGQLVVTATPQKMAEVRRLLATLDRPPARLLISVKRGGSSTGKQGSASVQGRAGNLSINKGGIAIGDRHSDQLNGDKNSLSVKMKSDSQNEQSNITQQVQVLEGREAYISAGEEIPVRNRSTVVGPGGIYGYDNVAYYPAVTGFYAIPRLNGDEVFLEINTVSRRRNNLRINGRYPQQGWQPRSNVAVTNVSTTARGKLGEWIAIGSIDQSAASHQGSIGSRNRQQQTFASQLFVRVEDIKGANR